MVQAYIEGYQERLFDQQCLAVQQGYWAGYFQSKKPKSANSIIEKMVRDHKKAIHQKSKQSVAKPEVDIERFMRLEAKRAAYMARQKVK